MSTSYLVLTVVAAVMVGVSAASVFVHATWVVQPLSDYGVPRTWWPWLGTAKSLGAVGLLGGLLVTPLGIAAAVALVLYFTGAVITVIRAQWYSHIPFPLVYVAPVIASLTAGIVT